MNILENIKQALGAVRTNSLRSFLTMLIIAFGIMALVGILTAIDSIIFSMSSNFTTMGANSFTIAPKGESVQGNRDGLFAKKGTPISFKQAINFKKKYNFPARVSVSIKATTVAEIKTDNKKTNPNISVFGIDENELEVRAHEIEIGRNFSSAEIENGANKIIVGADIVKQLFNGKAESALHKTVTVGSLKFLLIGVLKSKGASMNENSDRKVFIPIITAKRFYGKTSTNYDITVGVHDANEVERAMSTAIGLFRNVRQLKLVEENDFELSKSDGLISLLQENTAQIRIATIAIALITLLGAAIGLMNIMLVSVTERTREIGICKALGASRKNIMLQFLVEAITICQIGGIIGILLGIFIGNIVTFFLGGDFIIPWAWVILGFIVCLFVGLFSGIYPALKAARLDPIEALRHE